MFNGHSPVLSVLGEHTRTPGGEGGLELAQGRQRRRYNRVRPTASGGLELAQVAAATAHARKTDYAYLADQWCGGAIAGCGGALT